MRELVASRLLATWRQFLNQAQRIRAVSLPWVSGQPSLWTVLIALVLAVLVTLVWLAGRY
jgi:hypothetical protein